MKLIRCHIENFGVLSNFDFDFAVGLTTICQNNGFGKSTFAAFIKAMFYGFPRKNIRNIIENERKRYDPWQGGKYGGYIEFETQGVCYRVTRYFGKTAAKDTFSLIDLTNRQPSIKFSEKLGDELFQLDADSFARSTYVSRLSISNMEATTSIRTKLSNLVDDTNDLSNYDTAEKKLRDYRTKLRAYRGDGGTINNLKRNYLDLENNKYQAERQKPTLQETIKNIERLNGEKAAKAYAVNELREKIRLASDQKARQFRQKRLYELHTDVMEKQQELQKLDINYPAGYPTEKEIKEQYENLSIIQQKDNQLKELKLSDSDRRVVDTEKQWFEDINKTTDDIYKCDLDCKEFNKVSVQVTAQMLPEELDRLSSLSKRFELGIPTDQELEDCRKAADNLNDVQSQIANLSVSTESQNRFEQLEKLFKAGMPDENVLQSCEQDQHDRENLLNSRTVHIFPEAEQQQYENFKRTFAMGVPTEEEIHNKQKESRRIAELSTKKNTQTTMVQEAPLQEIQRAYKTPIICGVVGVGLLILGIGGFVMGGSATGIIFLVIGFVALLIAFWLHIKSMVNAQKQSATAVVTASAISDEENQELYNLQHTLNDFLLCFYDNVAEPDNKLVQLLIDVKSYKNLKVKKTTAENELQKIDAEIEIKNKAIQAVFERYFPNSTYRDDFIKKLRENYNEYKWLEDEVNKITKKRKELNQKLETYRSQVDSVLHKYYPIEMPNDLRQGTRELSDEVKEYNDLKKKNQTMSEGNTKYQIRADELTIEISNILLAYKALNQTLSFDICLQNLRKRFDCYKEANERVTHYVKESKSASDLKHQANKSVEQFLDKYQLSGGIPKDLINRADEDIRYREIIGQKLIEAQKKLKDFLEENPDIEIDTANTDVDLPDLEVLQESEGQILKQIEDIEKNLRNLRQERDRIRRSVENIPAWEDSMARIKAEQEEDEKRCAIVEKTIIMLSQAKDNLANSYIGKVEHGFEHYASELMENQLGDVMIDKDLHLYIDEKGVAREVGCFSDGTIDCIMLCMRLSLVDALFNQEKPFLILDDPFINLDDEHTKRALNMLNKIAEDHQVVYLVCNSSRQ